MNDLRQNPGWFYRKTSELQDTLNKRESDLHRLTSERSTSSVHMDKESLQQYWQKVLDNNRNQEERNKMLLSKLGRVEEHMAVLSNKASALNSLRERYFSVMKILTSMNVESTSRITEPKLQTTVPAEYVSNTTDSYSQRSVSLRNDSVATGFIANGGSSNRFHSAILVRHVATQTEEPEFSACSKCGYNPAEKTVLTTRDQLFRRVRSVSDLLGMSDLPKPPTPYPRMSTFSSMSSLASSHPQMLASNVSELGKRFLEPGHSRNFSLESLDYLSPVQSPKNVRRYGESGTNQKMLNEILSALPTGSENLFGSKEDAGKSIEADFANKNTLSTSTAAGKESNLTDGIGSARNECENIPVQAAIKKVSSSENFGELQKEHLASGRENHVDEHRDTNFGFVESSSTSNTVEPSSPALLDVQRKNTVSEQKTTLQSNAIQETNGTEKRVTQYENVTAETEHGSNISTVTNKSEPVFPAKTDSTTDSGEKHPQHVLASKKSTVLEDESANVTDDANRVDTRTTSEKLIETKSQAPLVINGGENSENLSPSSSATANVRSDKKEKINDDDDDKDNGNFFAKTSVVDETKAYQMLLGKVPVVSKVNVRIVESSSESSDEIENAFFTSVMTSTPQAKNVDNSSVSQVEENAKITKTSEEHVKTITAEDRQRIAKKVMHLGSGSDSDVNLSATKNESDSDDFFS